MTTGKRHREILEREADEIWIARFLRLFDKLRNIDVIFQRSQPRFVVARHAGVAGLDEVADVSRGAFVIVDEETAAHTVEQDVGQVMGVLGPIAGGLD